LPLTGPGLPRDNSSAAPSDRADHGGKWLDDEEPAPVPETWVLIPLYNEAAVIGDVVRSVRAVFPDVVCIDDGSHDDGYAQAAEAGAVVIRHAVNLGQGAALQTGLIYALRDPDARYFVTFDADGQHRVKDAAAMVDVLRGGEFDVVFGSRFLAADSKLGIGKRLFLRAAVTYSNLSTHVRLTDAHNGLRAFSRRGAQALDIRQDRMAHASEIVTQVGRAKLRWVEHPVQILYTDYSRAKGQSMFNAVNIVVDLLFKS
jgi:polyprenyl-phospho-N-acetylgalactosaminyl synthase